MSTRFRRENKFIERFLSAYESDSWADAKIDWLDEKIDGAVEALATRNSDGKTLAIEHTIVEPFVSEKEDFAFFEAAFLKIERDATLFVPGRWIQLFVPVGTLRGQRKVARDAIVEGIHDWLKTNRLLFPNGLSKHSKSIAIVGKTIDVALYVKVLPLPGPGKLHIRRQQMECSLGEVIEKVLKNKLPKLVRTNADRRLLFLERQHMNLHPTSMLDEIEKRKSTVPDLALVDEIWILETMFYDSDLHLGFERFQDNTLIGSFHFRGTECLDRFENGALVMGSSAH